MKKTLVILITAMTVTATYGQITTTKIAQKVEQICTPYDSTENFLKGEVYKYIGQELYLNGKSEKLREYGYRGFCLDYKKEMDKLSNTYYPTKPKNEIYESYDIGGGESQYDLLVGKYFYVLDVVSIDGLTIPFVEYRKDYNKKYFLKLLRKDIADTLYYHYDGYEHEFPFLVVGFIEKQKRKFIGKEFVFRDSEFEGATDIQTGRIVTIKTGQKWKCTDLTVEDKFYNLSLIFENSLGEKTADEYDRVINVAFTTKIADNYKNKFGQENFNNILKGKVKIGMTKEMCKLSWGEPKDINKTITSGKKSEQWVYSDNYLYFSNGILTAIQ